MNELDNSLQNYGVFDDDEVSVDDDLIRDSLNQKGQTPYKNGSTRCFNGRQVLSASREEPGTDKAEVHLILMRSSRAKSDANFFLYSSIEIQRRLDQMEGKWPSDAQLEENFDDGDSDEGDAIDEGDEIHGGTYFSPSSHHSRQRAERPIAFMRNPSSPSRRSQAAWWSSGAKADLARRPVNFRDAAGPTFMPFTATTRGFVLRPSSASAGTASRRPESRPSSAGPARDSLAAHGPDYRFAASRPVSAGPGRTLPVRFTTSAAPVPPAEALRRPASAPPSWRLSATPSPYRPPPSPIESNSSSESSGPARCPSPLLSTSSSSATATVTSAAPTVTSSSPGPAGPATDVERRYNDRLRRLRAERDAAAGRAAGAGAGGQVPWRPLAYRPLLAARYGPAR
jgi:hypothetical protein